ncbi:MAG: von Willebrand factor type A domain-containing protein [Ignavibacteriaceae bacterium]|nr:von Willebrand factor type A domain-containing protein [Ignavibacteriaceae bacterium]
MKNLIVFIVIVLSTLVVGQQRTGTIEGSVTDAQTGTALIGANVIIEGTRLGAATDVNGYYKIEMAPVGIYTVTARYIGYAQQKKENVVVSVGQSIKIDFGLITESYELSEVSVMSIKPLINKNTTMGGVNYNTGALRDYWGEPNFNTEEYSFITENDFFNAVEKPLSTFSIDVDAASYSNCRRFIMGNQLPPADAVRVEEFINYFDYDYPAAKGDKPFSVTLEYSDCPWNKDTKLVHIGLKGKEIDKREKKQSNLVFLLDVSGSMDEPKKLPLVQKAFNLLVDQLDEKDKIAIVVYAGAAGVVLPSTSVNEKIKIKDAINNLHAGGSTAGGEGLALAYKIADENFIKGGNNRIILATDGDFNVGVSSTSELVRFIEEKRDKGIFFTALGFGMGNYKDGRLQELADKGNGNHAYIDNILEAKKVFVNELSATLYTIAKDVKIQIEFNPVKVKSYRLIGYENRLLNDQDFTDDKKDAGEIGAGHTVTALYEIVPNENEKLESTDLKYQVNKIKPESYKIDELLSLKIRYKKPDEDKSVEYETVLNSSLVEIDRASDNFIFSSAVAEFAMLLRNSKYKGESNYKSVLQKAKRSKGKDEFGYRAEFINLVERVSLLSEKIGEQKF